MTTTQHEPASHVVDQTEGTHTHDTSSTSAEAQSAQPGLFRTLDDSGIPTLLARLILGGLMIWMAIPKILDPFAFLKLFNEYEMLSGGLAMNVIVVILPWLELIGGGFLVVGAGLRGVAAIMFVLLVGFTTVIAMRTISLVQGGQPFFEVAFDCGCGGGPTIIWRKLLENSGLILLAAWLLWTRSKRFSVAD